MPAVAQDDGGLSGIVTVGDSPVPGVTIHIETKSCDCRNCRTRCGRCCPASAFTVTDAKGHYSFPELSSGTFEIKVEAPGFSTKELTLTVPENGMTKNIELTSISEPITVTETIPTLKRQPSAGTAKGVIVEAKSGKSLKNAQILFVGTTPQQCKSWTICAWPEQTGDTGTYSVKLPAGVYRVVVATPKADVTAGTVKVVERKVTAATIKVNPE
ncbi:MAG: carboxypeptidase regulatory-like domain-containing protein [Acidobacteria bacterium]|nr:carboxypeptidase regulatory-like domain-containing protein [Acidobacteriota bacterium]MBV9069822.1 carboxypeptidase regulatory-like domain-containing protein [Acidobacteriota bacterium]MBV9187768.1 carboxypeptidase regulatory-like domain-containing protein [Acidobacteriota bacterium]